MPFGGFKDMADCMKQNADKKNPEGFCAEIMRAVEKAEQADGRFAIAKVDEERQIVFGWANVVMKAGETVEDLQGDRIRPEVLEDAAYLYNLDFREANAEKHFTSAVGQLVESFVATPEKLEKMGLAKDALPVGWWVGFHVDAPTFAKVKRNELTMFSIEGTARRVAA